MEELKKEGLEEDQEVKQDSMEEAGQEEAANEPAGEESEPVVEQDTSDADEPARKDKGFGAGRNKKLQALKEKNEELEDRVKRQMAEFENFRKRTEKEKSTMFEMGAKSVIEKLLPVVDNFERGLEGVPEDKRQEPVYEGMNLIYKQLMTELNNLGVKPIEALGAEFNPDFHNAVMQEESEEFEEGIVTRELQKGYTYRDTVVRHSMVAVAK